MIDEPWATLEITPTSNQRAIKSAYAAKLKRLDVETDPRGFVALREKLSWALQLSQHPFAEAQSPLPDREWTIDGGASSSPRTATPAQPIDAELSDLKRKQQGLLNLLDDTEGNEARICDAVVALLRSRTLANLDNHNRIELWLADIMAERRNISEPIINLVVYHFRWNEVANGVRTPRSIRQVVQRQSDLLCLAALRDPVHPWHLAFTELSTPNARAVTAADQRLHGSKIRLLLESLRTHNPEVENILDPQRVAGWDQVHCARSQETLSEITRLEALNAPPKRPFPWIILLAAAAQTIFLIMMFG